ncbi:MAG TPA: carboxypeptidase-like regulatory domain-containing protein [Methanomassiliicoccales archaeon]|nr:carboxypeptidase-like regulatory domain-containing protein [Methanomassiliicoccales archaeon]
MFLLLSTTLCVFATGTAVADSDSTLASVSGKVVDADGTGLAGITVELENGTSVISDAQGGFAIMVTPGEHTLTFSGPGINSRDVMISTDSSGLAMGNVWTTESNDAMDMTVPIVLSVVGLLVVLLLVMIWRKKKK